MPISIIIFVTSIMVMWLQLSASVTSAETFFLPGAEAAGPQAHKHRPDEFAEGGCIDRIQFLLLTVPQVMIIKGAPWQAHSLRCLIVVQQPLQLKIHKKTSSHNQWAPGRRTLLCDSHLVSNEEEQRILLSHQKTSNTSHTSYSPLVFSTREISTLPLWLCLGYYFLIETLSDCSNRNCWLSEWSNICSAHYSVRKIIQDNAVDNIMVLPLTAQSQMVC